MGKISKVRYTEEQLQTALSMAAEGHTVRKIIEAIYTNASQFWHFRQQNPCFEKSFQLARQEGLELLADDLINISDLEPDVNKARLKSENMRWLLSKRKPLVYGDRLDVNLNTTVDISGALKEARSRALPQHTESARLIDSTQDVEESSDIIIEVDDIFD